MNISHMEERLQNSTIILDLEPTIVTLQDHNLADVLIVSFSNIKGVHFCYHSVIVVVDVSENII